MRVAIAGGHGKIARHLSKFLAERGDQPVALIRNPDHEADVREDGAEPAICDLESDDEGAVAEAIRGADAVVFAAGAGPGSGSERKGTMDYGGAVKLIAAAKAEGIDRYVMVSAVSANAEAEGDDTFAVYLRAKGKADDDLMASGLAYTIIRPVSLTDEPGTGLVELAERVERGEVTREDVAAVLAECLQVEGTTGKTLALSSGETPVAQAVAAVAGGA